MVSVTRIWGGVIAASVLISMSACQPKVEPVKPSAEQQAALNRLHKKCKAAVKTTPSGKLTNLVRHRTPEIDFTCEDMKQLCETDYANDRCQSMMVVASIENAFHKACRTKSQPSACRKLTICNVQGFESPECSSAVQPYNR